MPRAYAYKFTHHTNSLTNDYKFIVYLVYNNAVYDFIDEFNGLEALKHYQSVQLLTPQQLQLYLKFISHNSFEKKFQQLAAQF